MAYLIVIWEHQSEIRARFICQRGTESRGSSGVPFAALRGRWCLVLPPPVSNLGTPEGGLQRWSMWGLSLFLALATRQTYVSYSNHAI